MRKAYEKADRVRLYIAVAVLALLTVIYLCICLAEDRRKAAVPEMIVSYTADQIARVTWKTGGGDVITVERREDGSFVLSTASEAGDLPENTSEPVEIDQDKGLLFFSSLTGIPISRTIGETASLADYGLDSPMTEAHIYGTDGTEESFLISAPEETAGVVYVIKNGDESRVCAVRSGFGSVFPETADVFFTG